MSTYHWTVDSLGREKCTQQPFKLDKTCDTLNITQMYTHTYTFNCILSTLKAKHSS